MIARLYERLTGRPWTTTRSMAAEYGPTPATRYPELADYPDAVLVARDREQLLAEIEAARRGGLVSLETVALGKHKIVLSGVLVRRRAAR